MDPYIAHQLGRAGSWRRAGSRGRSELTVLAGIGVGAGIGEILRTPTPVRSRKLHVCSSIDGNFD